MRKDPWIRSAVITRVVDGDTVDAQIDLGFRVFIDQRLRLHGINAPEPKGETRVAGLAATQHLVKLLAEPRTVVIKSRKTGKYGRWLAEIWVGETNINEQMVKDGHAEKSG